MQKGGFFFEERNRLYDKQLSILCDGQKFFEAAKHSL